MTNGGRGLQHRACTSVSRRVSHVRPGLGHGRDFGQDGVTAACLVGGLGSAVGQVGDWGDYPVRWGDPGGRVAASCALIFRGRCGAGGRWVEREAEGQVLSGS